MNMDLYGLVTVKEIVFKKLSDKVHEFVGSWAWFFGSVMADSFYERLHDLEHGDNEEESNDSKGKPN